VPDRAASIAAALVCALTMAYVAAAPERPLARQPFPDSAEYADSARALAQGQGFVTYVHQGAREPPRYPPGYPLALVPFAAVGTYPGNVQLGAKLYAVLYVLVAVIAAWAIGGALAGGLSAAFVAASPFARDAAGLVLSDALVATATVLMLPLLRPVTRAGSRLAGAAAGAAVIVRLSAVVNLLAVLVAWPRRSNRTVLLFALPALAGLAALQWAMFGSPLETGYSYWGVSRHNFAFDYLTTDTLGREGPFVLHARLEGPLLSWVCPCGVGGPSSALPNLSFYPLVLLGIFWVFSPPLLPLLGLVYAWSHRRDPLGRYALAVTVMTLAIFGAYSHQATRFMAGPGSVLSVLASVWLAELAGRRRFAPRLVELFARSVGDGLEPAREDVHPLRLEDRQRER
jgi:4-amino-4-deoxy-L-arabinose transferase-like glycosyltransferase